MQRAIELLDERDTGVDTVALQQLAVRRFQELTDALADDDTSPQSQQAPAENSQGEPSSGPEGDIVTLIAQLKVIRGLQLDLADRFRTVRSRSEPGTDLDESDRTELQAIAEEQAMIADLVREMTSAFGDPEVEPGIDDAAPEPELP